MRKSQTIPLIILIVTAIPLANLYADIYQYTDQNGVVHFTNVNGGGKNHKKIKSEPQPRVAENETSASQYPAYPEKKSPAMTSIPPYYRDIIARTCDKYNVDPSLVHAIVKVESDFNPLALSRKGAMGLMQLMPQTAVDLNVKNTFSPHENIDGGVRYLRYLMDRYEGNLPLALAAYNAGETSVQRWGTVPPFKETKNYVKKILRLYEGKGQAFAPRYTIFIGHREDGSIVFTDNPHNYPGKTIKQKAGL